MKNALILCSVLLITALSSGCQTNVSGRVFLDTNGNGVYDSEESGVPYAKLMVTRDDKLVAEYYADTNGLFDIPLKSKSGYVCVDTDLSFAEANFGFVMQTLGKQVSAQALKVTPPKAQKVKAATTSTSSGVTLSPSEINFGNQTVDTTSSARTVTLTNNSTTNITIDSISASGDFSGTSDCGVLLSATASCSIEITFEPTATGSSTGTLSVEDSATGSPHTVALSGTGVTGSSSSSDSTESESTESGGWTGTKYCQQMKFKGFEVDIPVTMSFEEAISEMPKRLKIECYAGQECDVAIAYPQGCTLAPLSLPEGLTMDRSGSLPGVESYDQIFNIVNFTDVSISQTKASTTGPTYSVSGYGLVNLKLRVDDDIDVGTTEVKLEPSAECLDEELSLESIPIDLIREISVGVYQHLITPLDSSGMIASGTNVTIRALVENRGHNTVTNGDLTFIPPTGSVIQNSAGCANYGTKVICRAEKIEPGELFYKDIVFKLASPSVDTEVGCDASFVTPDMDTEVSADTVTFTIKAAT